MGGRYASFLPAEAIARIFSTVKPLPDLAPFWNVAQPTQGAAVVRRHPVTGGPHLDLLKWDFLPIVKLERMRRGGNPAWLFVSESHRILIAIASGGNCAASAADLIEPRVRAFQTSSAAADCPPEATGSPGLCPDYAIGSQDPDLAHGCRVGHVYCELFDHWEHIVIIVHRWPRERQQNGYVHERAWGHILWGRAP